MTDRKPAESFHLGTVVLKKMEARGWGPDKLVMLLRWMPFKLDGILAGRLRVTPAMAKDLERVLQSSAEFWLNLQRLYDGQPKVTNDVDTEFF